MSVKPDRLLGDIHVNPNCHRSLSVPCNVNRYTGQCMSPRGDNKHCDHHTRTAQIPITLFAWRDSVKQLKRNEDFPQSAGFFLQPMGFPFDIQGPGSSRNILLHFLHNKAIEDGNQTCSPPFL